MKDSSKADDLVQLEGKNIIGFDFTFDVESFEDFKIDLLCEEELKNKW